MRARYFICILTHLPFPRAHESPYIIINTDFHPIFAWFVNGLTTNIKYGQATWLFAYINDIMKTQGNRKKDGACSGQTFISRMHVHAFLRFPFDHAISYRLNGKSFHYFPLFLNDPKFVQEERRKNNESFTFCIDLDPLRWVLWKKKKIDIRSRNYRENS